MPKLKFSLLKTHSNIFVLSPMALDFVQDSAHGLAGKARLDDQAVLYWPKKNDTGQLIKWRPVYMIRITGAAIKAIQMAASGSQKMSSLVVGRTEAAAAKKDSFKPPKPGEWVDAEWFKEMLAKCTRDPECCEYFDPKEFAENVTMVISFDDQYKRVFYHVTVAFGKDEFAYRLYVNPIPRSDFEGEPSFYYGKEFCVLIKE